MYMKASWKDGFPYLKELGQARRKVQSLAPVIPFLIPQGPTWEFQHIHGSCKVCFKRLGGFFPSDYSSLPRIFPSPRSALPARKIPLYFGPTVCQAGFQSFMRCSLHRSPEPALQDAVPERRKHVGRIRTCIFSTATVLRMCGNKNTHSENFLKCDPAILRNLHAQKM